MPEPVRERALAAFGPIFVQIYGLTEAPHPDLILDKHEHLPDPVTGRRVGQRRDRTRGDRRAGKAGGRRRTRRRDRARSARSSSPDRT